MLKRKNEWIFIYLGYLFQKVLVVIIYLFIFLDDSSYGSGFENQYWFRSSSYSFESMVHS
jgi:hypothetical protein